MNNEMLSFALKIIGSGLLAVALTALIIYGVKKEKVADVKAEFSFWNTFPFIIAVTLNMGTTENHFPHLPAWQRITYCILLLLPFMYGARLLIRKWFPNPDKETSQ